jgi:prolyl oligopeptidase PreP (S9A serine peptidase family)
MGYLKKFSRAYDKELDIKKKLESIDPDKKDKILAICRKLRKRDITEFLHEADRMMKLLTEGKSLEDIEKLYRLDEMYELEKAEVANGWKFSQVRLGRW